MDEEQSTTSENKWCFWGRRVPKAEIMYLCQLTIVFIVVVSSIVNMTLDNGSTELWISLLSSSIGYILPNPSIDK